MPDITPIGPAFGLALLCAGLMGFAIQRGATCMVAAIGQVVIDRRADWLIALGEASLWVAALLSVAALAGWSHALPHGYPLTIWTAVGGALLGIGAYINRACVFGAIARLGSGDIAYFATPIGFYFGCLTIQPIIASTTSPSIAVQTGPTPWLLLAISAPVLAWRSIRIGGAARMRMLAAHVWSPHVATAVIGITFAIMILAVGTWAYTDALAQLAHGMAMNGIVRAALFAGLLGGSIIGGWTAGKINLRRPSVGSMARCFVGGFLMGWGSLLIPGGNDGLILIGLPFLQPFAFVALGVMAVTIGVATWLSATQPMEPTSQLG